MIIYCDIDELEDIKHITWMKIIFSINLFFLVSDFVKFYCLGILFSYFLNKLIAIS